MADELFGVTGAGGEVGGRVAFRLGEIGARQRLIVREGARLSKPQGAELREITDYGDKNSFRAAAEGFRPRSWFRGASTRTGSGNTRQR